MKKLSAEHMKWRGEREIGWNYILITGNYSYIPDYGWTMDEHIKELLEDYSVVSHQIHEGYGVRSSYSVMMKKIPEDGA